MRHLKEWVSIKEIAAHCMVDRITVRRWIKSGKLSAFRLPSGHYRIKRVDFLTFLEKWHMPVEDYLVVPGSKESEG